MAVLWPQEATRSGVNLAFAVADSAGDQIPNDGQTLLHFNNVGSAKTVTIARIKQVRGLLADNLVISLPDSQEKIAGPFPVNEYGETLSLTYSSATLLFIAAYRPAVRHPLGFTVFDSFTGSGIVEQTETGQAWASRTFTKLNGHASTTGILNQYDNVADSKLSDCLVRVTAVNQFHSGIIFRYELFEPDLLEQFWACFNQASDHKTYLKQYDDFVGTSFSDVAPAVAGAADGDILEAQMIADHIQILRNGVVIFDVTDSFGQIHTKHGIFGGDGTNTALVDDFIVARLT